MNKVISYSLWGNNPKYIIGAYRNIELANKFFPDWKIKLYVSTNTNLIIDNDNVEIVYRTETQDQEGCFWRFEACDSDDIVIVRDLDDRLSERHKFVVDEWLSSDKDIHIIKDHPNHTFPIMAGLWGCRNGILKGFTNDINSWYDKGYYTTDQYFLANSVFNKYLDRSLVHDSFNKSIPGTIDISIPRISYEFLGDTFDENEQREFYWKIIEAHIINQNT